MPRPMFKNARKGICVPFPAEFPTSDPAMTKKPASQPADTGPETPAPVFRSAALSHRRPTALRWTAGPDARAAMAQALNTDRGPPRRTAAIHTGRAVLTRLCISRR